MARTEPDWSSSDWPCESSLEQAVAYVAAVRGAADPVARLRAVGDRAGGRALIRLVTELPVVEAPFSASPSGDELRSWFKPHRRLPVDRVPVAMLRLPAEPAEYFRGRPRQALRTNINRAVQAGLSCAVVPPGPEVRRSVEHVARLRSQDPASVLRSDARPGVQQQFVVVHDAAGDPVGISECVLDGEWAGLGALVIALGHADNQVMRYLLQGEMVKALIGEGVRALTVGGSMLLTSSGTRYFQRRTGYQPVWLRPVDRRAVAGSTAVEPPEATPSASRSPVPARAQS